MSVRTRPAEEAARPSPAGLDSTEWSALPLTAKINVVRRAVRTLWARRFPDLSEGATVRIEGNAKFMSARDAAQWIPDDAVLGISGLGTNQGAGAMFHAVRQRYEKSGHPRRVTLVCVGGVGARGKGRGSVEEMARKGLITRFFAGHVESFKELLAVSARSSSACATSRSHDALRSSATPATARSRLSRRASPAWCSLRRPSAASASTACPACTPAPASTRAWAAAPCCARRARSSTCASTKKQGTSCTTFHA